jgi:nicotinate-nucleotide adenylyltransferase
LARAAGAAELVLLLGADQFATLDEWHDPERIRGLATIAVAPRPGVEIVASSATLIAMPEMDIASSEIRRRIAAGESIDGLVSPSVAALIVAEGLYQSGGAG